MSNGPHNRLSRADRLLGEWADLTRHAQRPDPFAARRRWSPVRSLATAGAVGMLGLVVLVVVLGRPATGGPAAGQGVELPTYRPLGAYPAALAFGRLEYDGECVYVVGYHGEGRNLVIWPRGTWLDTIAAAPVVRRADGEAIAAIGEPVELGGGEYKRAHLDWLRSDLLENDIPPACEEGPYWLASTAQSPLAGVGIATWRLDPAYTVTPDSTTLHILLTEQACANGLTPEGRLLPPVIEYRPDAILISIGVRRFRGADCPSNPEYALAVELDEPVGQRSLVAANRHVGDRGQRRLPHRRAVGRVRHCQRAEQPPRIRLAQLRDHRSRHTVRAPAHAGSRLPTDWDDVLAHTPRHLVAEGSTRFAISRVDYLSLRDGSNEATTGYEGSIAVLDNARLVVPRGADLTISGLPDVQLLSLRASVYDRVTFVVDDRSLIVATGDAVLEPDPAPTLDGAWTVRLPDGSGSWVVALP